jgi:hypothetical protein
MIREGTIILVLLSLFNKVVTQGPRDLEIQGEAPMDINIDDIDISQAYYQEKVPETQEKNKQIDSKKNVHDEIALQDLYYPDEFAAGNTGRGGYPGIMPGRVAGYGGHPGMMGGNMGDVGHIGGHPGMMGGHIGGPDIGRGGHNIADEMAGLGMPEMLGRNGHRSNSNNQPQHINSNNDPKSFMGKFSGIFSSSIYEIMMLIFVGGFIYNCIFGRHINDKFATAWYNANKKYFEDSYTQLAITKDKEEENIQQFGTPMM